MELKSNRVYGDGFRPYKDNTEKIGDAANAGSVIVNAFDFSRAQNLLLKCMTRFMQTENLSDTILSDFHEFMVLTRRRFRRPR